MPNINVLSMGAISGCQSFKMWCTSRKLHCGQFVNTYFKRSDDAETKNIEMTFMILTVFINEINALFSV
ncbi:unnamed protein product [Allacma fusca]|uniref:Uncharacterized protein n=1 Tax=Allacma fusca TaxID=39272 RepID=A0A8J2P4E1_9HEXA|nr:unnamed protein product [Allacma fusca]